MKRTRPGRALGEANEILIVALAIGGDDTAFGELVRRRQGAIRNLLRRLSGDTALADDLAQQAFLQAWRAIGSLKSPAAFGAWLRRLAVNGWLAHLRSRHRGAEADPRSLPEGGANSAVTERMDLDAALATLAPQARLCVVLAYSEGLSHAEISDSTGIALGTVKSHIARGALRLRELLKDYGDHHDE